jgi:predicted amidohydrolase
VACVQLSARGVEDSDASLEDAVSSAQRAARRADLVVLPEATYPGYVLHNEDAFLDSAWWDRGVAAFAEVARSSGAHVVVGLIRTVGARVRNSAAILGPDGRLLGVIDKSFLWHFDSQWFEAGLPSEVLELPFGKLGGFICADARMMEIPRRLAVCGARLLVDPTALVLGPAGTNAQLDYMLSVRAWENGSWLAVANKCGREAGIAHYAGHSAIFGPDGTRVAEASPDQADIVTAVVDLSRAKGPPVERGRDGYPEVSRPLERMPIARELTRPPPARPLRVAFVQRPGSEDRIRRELVADLVVTRGSSSEPGVLATTKGRFTLGGSLHSAGEVVDTGYAKVGFIGGDRIAVPEEVRSLMLRGASAVVWDRHVADAIPLAVIRTRADENRVFVVVTSADGTWRVIAPSGALLAESDADRSDAVLVELHLSLAWHKEMAPTTDVVGGRQPAAYTELARGGVMGEQV